MKREFRRRIYASPGEWLNDLGYIMSRRAMIRRAMRQLIPVEFRERIMMVVTEVNGCRYCSHFHSSQALNSGVSEEELRELLAGNIPARSPAEELPALFYAQHWAESNAQPGPQAEQHLREIYGGEKAEAIHIILRMIRMGNLLGNTADYLLYQLSFGKFGLRKDETRFHTLETG